MGLTLPYIKFKNAASPKERPCGGSGTLKLSLPAVPGKALKRVSFVWYDFHFSGTEET